MWLIDNDTPFAADRGWCRDRDGAEVWLVVVKATFLVHPDGSTSLAAEQVEPLHEAKHRGEPGKSSVLYDGDFVRTKVTTDVVLNGSAHAPAGRPASRVDVAFRVDDLQRSARVVGERLFERQLTAVKPGRPEPFVRLPMTYERTFGGTDRDGTPHAENPVGTGYARSPATLIGRPAPNVQPVSDASDGWTKSMGFGAVASHWSPRTRFAGTYDAGWQRSRAPLVPDDFDDRFFNSAPAAQQTPRFLRGGEAVSLLNLTPAGKLSFRLPRVALSLETEFKDSAEAHDVALHTVILEPDVPRVIMVWHSALRCHGRVEQLLGTSVTQKLVLSDSSRQGGSAA
jgi:hypothetical protein